MNLNIIDMDSLLDELEQTTEGFSYSSSIEVRNFWLYLKNFLLN